MHLAILYPEFDYVEYSTLGKKGIIILGFLHSFTSSLVQLHRATRDLITSISSREYFMNKFIVNTYQYPLCNFRLLFLHKYRLILVIHLLFCAAV